MKMLAFALTTAIAVPLDADIQSDGPQLRPKQSSFELEDGTTISLDLDRGVMPAGGKASVTLVATSDHAHEVTVALRALQDMGYGGERVPNPPLEVDARKVTLDAQPGGGPPVVATFKLDRSGKVGRYEWFDIVASSKHAVSNEAASVGVATWTGNTFAMTIEPPAQMPAEGAFTMAVRIKNTTKKPMAVPDIRLGAKIGGVDGLDSQLVINDDDYNIEHVPDPASDDDEDPKIAPGAEYLAVYKVSPRFGIDHFTFVAHAHAYETGAALTTLVVDRPTPATDDTPAGPLATH